MRFSFLFIILLAMSVFTISGQTISTINCKANYFTVDNLDNIYLVNGVSLMKLNPDGSQSYEFSDYMLGEITSVDVKDPLRILVYYKEQNQVLFLDNKLAKIASPILLDEIDVFSSNAACVSYQNHFWIYDDQKYELLQFNENRELIQQSTSFDQILDNYSSSLALFEKNNFVYLNLLETGILVFDNFGSYYKTFPRKGITSFQVVDDYYFYIDSGIIKYYDLNYFIEKKYVVDVNETIRQVYINKDKFYILLETKLIITNSKF